MPLFKKKNQPSLKPGINLPTGKQLPSASSQQQPSADPKQAASLLAKGLTSIQDVIAPPSIEVDFSFLKLGQTFCRTLFVAGYPRFVTANWLAPLINFNHTLDISLYIYPVEGRGILDDLRKKIGEMEAEIQTDIQRGKVVNVETQVKLEDAKNLQKELAKGAERFFQFALYITISAANLKSLNKITKQVQATLGSLMIAAKSATLQMEDGFKTTLPTCSDKLRILRNMDTTSLASTFPFTSSELTANEGIMYGINEHNDSLIIFDRFSLENANMVVLSKSGGGKSLDYHEEVLIKNRKGHVSKQKIGRLIERLIKEYGSKPIDKEMEGVINPPIKVYSFNKNLKNQWSKVTVAARKKAPKTSYRFTTTSGRKIATTADHNLITLQNGQLITTRGDQIKKGDFIPLPRLLKPAKTPQKHLNIWKLLKNNARVYVKGAGSFINRNYQYLKRERIDPFYDKYLYKYRLDLLVPLPYLYKIVNKLPKLKKQEWKNLKISSCKFKDKAWLSKKLKISPYLLRLLGYIVSEGTINSNFILISNTQKKILEDISLCFEKLKLRYYLRRKGIRKTGIVCSVRVFTELIKTLKIGNRAGRKRVPGFIFNLSNENITQFLKAYFTGDGTVNSHDVSATSKSEMLISDLMYLLLKFGIVSRKRNKFKRATNSNHKGDHYYQIVISGQDNLKKFHRFIGFISKQKADKLNQLLEKKENTNVDIVPGLEPIFKQIYHQLYSSSQIRSPNNLSPLKRRVFNPSRKVLKKLIKNTEERIEKVEALWPRIQFLNQLPDLSCFCQMATKDKKLNCLLWKEMGHSWQLMKKEKVVVGTINAFRAFTTATGHTYSFEEVKEVIYTSFNTLGESLKNFDHSLWTAITRPRSKNTAYKRIMEAAKFLDKIWGQKKLELENIKQRLASLKKLTNSDLFWDPIAKVEKIKNKEKYVYDLTVNNEVFLAGFGGMFVHNSFAIKLEALRSLLFGTEIIVIDPESEYQDLCETVGGEYISFAPNSPAKINPFDLSLVSKAGENELGLKILSLHSLFKIIMGQLKPQEEALLDRALVLTYQQKGITADPQTQSNRPPLMEDLYKVLIGMEQAEATSLAARLERFIKGSLRGIFNQHSTVKFTNQFTAFSTKELEDKLRPIAIFIILDFIWTKIKRQMKKRHLIVDEAWYLMKNEDSASFLYGIAKRARKYFLGVTTITQDVEDFLNNDYGKAIITNSSIQLLMKQSPAAIDTLAQVFYLSQGEKNLLLACDVGHGLFFAGTNHVAIKVMASPEEYQVITSKPEEILAKQKQAAAVQPQPQPPPTPPVNVRA